MCVIVAQVGVQRRSDSLCALGVCKSNQVLMPDEDLTPLVDYEVQGIVGMTFLEGSRIYLDASALAKRYVPELGSAVMRLAEADLAETRTTLRENRQ